jgi:uncharacterized protein (DUF1800 family)
MGNDKLQRKDFLKSIFGLDKSVLNNNEEQPTPENGNDPLFEKFSRKSLGNRSAATEGENVNNNNTVQRVAPVTSGIAPYTGAWTETEVIHLLKRVSYGAKKADVDTYMAMTPSAAVDALLNFTPNPVLPTPAPLRYDTLTAAVDGAGYNDTIATGADWTTTNIPYAGFGAQYYRRLSHQYWNWGVCINDATSIREKMQLFWYHFIPVGFEDIENIDDRNSATVTHDYMKLLRNNCLGNFKTLIKNISKTPAMLYYLSNHFSTATTPNENFARELMELFTIGKVPQNYTEEDVQVASRVFSGWRILNTGSVYPVQNTFTASRHNTTGSRVFSLNFGGLSIPAGTTDATKAAEFDAFFDLLFTQQATTISKYISRRLYRFFVYYDTDSTVTGSVEDNVITPLANLLVASNWDILPVVKALLKSQHFFDIINRGVMIKSPFDLIIGLIRSLNVNTTAATAATPELTIGNQYKVWAYFQNYANNNLLQGFGNIPTVAGWKAYYQDPTYYQNWINSETVQRRETLMKSFINGLTISGTPVKIDVIAYVQQFPNATVSNPESLVDVLVKYLLPKDLPAATKLQIKNTDLLGNTSNNDTWIIAWSSYVASPTNTTFKTQVTNKLKALFTTLLTLAENQLM